MRKRRAGETVCKCGVYGFPHRFMGGVCDGQAFVATIFERTHGGGPCKDCYLCETEETAYGQERLCAVVQGREPAMQCPELVEHIAFEGTKLYGVNKPIPKKLGWRR